MKGGGGFGGYVADGFGLGKVHGLLTWVAGDWMHACALLALIRFEGEQHSHIHEHAQA